ncbi:putative mitochondrial carrier [Spathaspora sp. JA1]|nr:putative mitochondrial carrier [Spathaspora sp. JA1]
MTTDKPRGDNLLTALVSGCTASAVTSTVTYPFDFLKTQEQLNNPQLMKKYNILNGPHTLGQMSKGCSALVIGSVLKNGTRLISYNWASKFMAIERETTTTNAPRTVIAGVISAFFETLWIIPFENVKIIMVQNQTLVNEMNRVKDSKKVVTRETNLFKREYVSPHKYYTTELFEQYFGTTKSKFTAAAHKHVKNPTDVLIEHYNKHPSLTLSSTIKEIYSIKGIRGFTSGSFITFARQIAISWVWLSTYNATRQLIDPHKNSSGGWFGHDYNMFEKTGLHLISSLAVIAVTQPLDVIKSHIQSKNGKVLYRDSLSTGYKLFMQQGISSLFKGALPRWCKLIISGGLTASVYGYVEDVVDAAGGEKMFDA